MTPQQVLQKVSTFTNNYSKCIEKYKDTTKSIYQEMAWYWWNERLTTLDTLSKPRLSDEEYNQLTIY